MLQAIDLNADVGEGFPYDPALLDVISSANIACGFHAGDKDLMRRSCSRCAELGVAVGAQVSYRDRAGFGRRTVEIGYDDLRADLAEQREVLDATARVAGLRVSYLKPHGALYHRVVWDHEQAAAVVDAAEGLAVLGLPGSVLLEQAATAGLQVAREFFADRGYAGNGNLLPRSHPSAVVSSPAAAADRVARLVEDGTVIAVDGATVEVPADSICVHGDTKGAPEIARAVASVLAEHSVAVRRFA